MCFPVVLSGSLDKFSHFDCELFEQKRVFVGILLFLQKLECSEQSLISDTNGWEDVFGQVLRCPWQIVVHEVEVCLVADVAICDHVVESDPQWFYRVFFVVSLIEISVQSSHQTEVSDCDDCGRSLGIQVIVESLLPQRLSEVVVFEVGDGSVGNEE